MKNLLSKKTEKKKKIRLKTNLLISLYENIAIIGIRKRQFVTLIPYPKWRKKKEVLSPKYIDFNGNKNTTHNKCDIEK